MTTTETETRRTAGRKSRSDLPLAAYVRVSRQGEREDDRFRSPDFQRELLDRWSAAEGRRLRHYEPEIDVSGSKASRPILDEIVAAIERGELGGLVVVRLDRLSRLKPKDRIELFDRIEEAGGEVLSASENLDASTREGHLAREIFLGIAHYQWRGFAEAFAHSKENAIALGIPIAKVEPFGYRRGADRRYEVVEAEAAVVRKCFELRAAGASRGTILAYFEQATGRRSSVQTIAYMLSNRVYLGELHYGRTDETRLSNLDAHTAIVELDLFDAAQKVERDRRAPAAGSRGQRVALLSGIARCAACGSGLARDRRSGRAPSGEPYPWVYACKGRDCKARVRIPAAELDAHVLETVLEWAGPVADELVEVEREVGAAHSRIVLETQVEQARESLRAWSEDVEAELADPEAYQRGLQARRALVERREAELEAAGEASEIEVARGTIRGAFAGDVPVAERRRLLNVVLSAVLVTRAPFGTAVASRVQSIFRAETEEAVELAEQATT